MQCTGDRFVIPPMDYIAHRPQSVHAAVASIQGSREAQELINALRAGVASSEALHWALLGIRRAGDNARLRAFTKEIQHALREGQRRASDLRELKRFTDLRARLQAVGVHLYRTDPADGPPTFFTATRGVIRPHVDLDLVQDLTLVLEAGQRPPRAARRA